MHKYFSAKLILFTVVLFSSFSLNAEIHEFVTFQFRSNIKLSEQKKLMKSFISETNSIFSKIQKREIYFSQENNEWIDHVIWKDLESAKNAQQLAMNNKNVLKYFEKMDRKSIRFGHYNLVKIN